MVAYLRLGRSRQLELLARQGKRKQRVYDDRAELVWSGLWKLRVKTLQFTPYHAQFRLPRTYTPRWTGG